LASLSQGSSTVAWRDVPDPTFPALHIRPRTGWLNDPNGLCLIDGRYHVFFQYNPAAPVHEAIAWGHVSSADLLSWVEHPLALTPRAGGLDGAGCWSGCVADDAGVPTACYTGNPGHARDAGVMLARSDSSLLVWTQQDAYVVDPSADQETEVRDPFIFTFDGHRYAVQGAGSRFGRPELQVWDCDDLESWIPLGSLLTDDDPIAAAVAPGNIWECPNLVLVDGHWVLLISLWRWAEGTDVLAGVRYLLGDLARSGDGLRFSASCGGVVDTGPAFYAPQVLSVSGRSLLWGWAWELGRTVEQVAAAGWAGVLTFPRELVVRDGVLGARPARELERLRRDLPWQPGQPIREGAFEVMAEGPVRLRLVGAETAQTVADLTGSAAEPVRIFVDGSIVEIFQAGRTHTTRAYPETTGHWLIDADAAEVALFRLAL
jgi:beta-fructofuranosidase